MSYVHPRINKDILGCTSYIYPRINKDIWVRFLTDEPIYLY